MKIQLELYQQRVNHRLTQALSAHTTLSESLMDAIRYATLNNGKRLRPALVYATGQALNIPLEKLDAAAVAIELIHSYSLVHDDLPAMDDDDLRRGQPTCHIQYNEATAILVGDAQQTLAFQLLAEDTSIEAEHRIKMIQLLSQASGIQGMISGQYIDIQNAGQLPSVDALENMHNLKTGALIQAALLIGACQSNRFADLTPCLADFGQKIGLLFQVQDDILDIESDTETLGKPQGSDQQADKATYPKLLGLNKAKQLKHSLVDESKTLLTQTSLDSAFLNALIDYFANRTH